VRRFVVLAILSISLVAGACQPGASPVTFAPSQGALMTLDDMSGACAISKAWGGPASSSPIPQLTSCSLASPPYSTLPTGSLVTTSTCGQAWLQVGGECGKIYVFHTTTLVASACTPILAPPTGYTAAAGCLKTGTAAWFGSSCSADLRLATPSAGILLAGTWASMTYIEDRQLSLFVMLDGSAEATPILDAEGQTFGDSTTLAANQFWFSAPGDVAPIVAGIDGRVAQPLEDLPAVVHELGLESWFAEVFDRAAQDGFDVSQVASIPVVQVRLAGGRLEDPAMRTAALMSFEWRSQADALLQNGADVALVALAGDDPPLDLRSEPFDPEFSSAAINEAGGFGVDVVWAKGNVEPFANAFVEALRQVGLDAVVQPVADEGAAAELFEASIGSERAVIWLTEH
jgi:hypothetical protein